MSEQEPRTSEAIFALNTTLATLLGGIQASLRATDNQAGATLVDALLEISHALYTANELQVLQMIPRQKWSSDHHMTFRAIAHQHGVDPEDTSRAPVQTFRAPKPSNLRLLGQGKDDAK